MGRPGRAGLGSRAVWVGVSVASVKSGLRGGAHEGTGPARRHERPYERTSAPPFALGSGRSVRLRLHGRRGPGARSIMWRTSHLPERAPPPPPPPPPPLPPPPRAPCRIPGRRVRGGPLGRPLACARLGGRLVWVGVGRPTTNPFERQHSATKAGDAENLVAPLKVLAPRATLLRCGRSSHSLPWRSWGNCLARRPSAPRSRSARRELTVDWRERRRWRALPPPPRVGR